MLNLYSSKDQKANADEMLPWVLDNMGFQQSYVPEFVRLACRVIAVAIAGALFYYERLMTWHEIYYWVVAATAAYFGLNGAAWLIKRFVEHNAIYIGTKDGKTLYIKTTTPPNSQEYKVELEYNGQHSQFTTKFADFVDHNARIVQSKIQPMLEAALKKDS